METNHDILCQLHYWSDQHFYSGGIGGKGRFYGISVRKIPSSLSEYCNSPFGAIMDAFGKCYRFCAIIFGIKISCEKT